MRLGIDEDVVYGDGVGRFAAGDGVLEFPDEGVFAVAVDDGVLGEGDGSAAAGDGDDGLGEVGFGVGEGPALEEERAWGVARGRPGDIGIAGVGAWAPH
ncbi:MAG: hypothetical protein R3293_28000, partial [Candidatus Promineifilaceae bacterium]|nr:hypothetical protein [Candidatus Promineifilaceae bacterium]